MRLDEKVNAEALGRLSGEARRDFLEGLRILGVADPTDRQALREAIRRLRPDFTEAQVSLFCDGRVKPETEPFFTEALADQDRADFIRQIANGYRELNPGVPETDVAQWAVDNEEKVKSKLAEPNMAPLTIAHCVSAVLQDEADEAKAQEIPDALAARHPEWSLRKRETWLNDHEPLLLAYRGLHPEWSGEQLVDAVDEEARP